MKHGMENVQMCEKSKNGYAFFFKFFAKNYGYVHGEI